MQVWGLDLPAWLAGQVQQESGWRDGLTSSAGARGLTQFIPSTAEGMERLYPGLAGMGRYSPKWAFYSQSLLMRDLFLEFGKDRTKCQGLKLASAGYNGSPTTLRREIALCSASWPDCDSRLWDENVAVKNARANHHWRESRNYVSRISRSERPYSLAGWGTAYCGG